jgi:biopolymer transport protein ExbD
MMQAFAYTHVLPTKQLFLAVVPATAYTIAACVPDAEVLDVKPGTETPIRVRIARKENAKFGVTLTAVRLANGQLTSKSVFVPPDKDEAEIVLTVAKDAKPQRQDVILSGLMRANNQNIVRFTRAIPVRIAAP